MWHPKATLALSSRFRARCTPHTRHGRSRLTGKSQGWAFDDVSSLHMQAQRQGCASRRMSEGRHAGTKAKWGRLGGYTVSGYVSQVGEVPGADAASARRWDGSRLRGSIFWRERVSCCSAMVARRGSGPVAERDEAHAGGEHAVLRVHTINERQQTCEWQSGGRRCAAR